VLAELRVGCHEKLRDKVWSEAVLLDRFEDRAVIVEQDEPHAYHELIEVFDAAYATKRRGVRHLSCCTSSRRRLVCGSSKKAAW